MARTSAEWGCSSAPCKGHNGICSSAKRRLLHLLQQAQPWRLRKCTDKRQTQVRQPKALFSSCLPAGNPLRCTYRCRRTLSHIHPSHPNILSRPPSAAPAHPKTHISEAKPACTHHRCPPSPKLPSGSGPVSASSLLSTMLSYSVMSWTTSTSSSRMACAVEMNSAGRTLQARDKKGTAHSSAPAHGNGCVKSYSCRQAKLRTGSHTQLFLGTALLPVLDQDTHMVPPPQPHTAPSPHLLGSLRSSMGSPKLGLTLTARLGGRAGMLPAGV